MDYINGTLKCQGPALPTVTVMIGKSWVRWVFSLLLSNLSAAQLFRDSSQLPFPAPDHHEVTKRIAIVGAGSSGLSTLRTFVADLPEETRQGWQIVIFEKRNDIGGIW